MKKVLGAALAAMLMAGTANAVVLRYDVRAGVLFNNPFEPRLDFSFTIDFPAGYYTSGTINGIPVSNIPVYGSSVNGGAVISYSTTSSAAAFQTSQAGFNYDNGYLVFGPSTTGVNSVSPNRDDFYIGFSVDPLGFPIPLSGDFGVSGGGRIYTGFVESVRRTAVDTAASVPEPATWATMMLGFGLIGATVRRRKVVLTA